MDTKVTDADVTWSLSLSLSTGSIQVKVASESMTGASGATFDYT